MVATISLDLPYMLAKKYAFKPGAIAAIIIALRNISISIFQEYIPSKKTTAGWINKEVNIMAKGILKELANL